MARTLIIASLTVLSLSAVTLVTAGWAPAAQAAGPLSAAAIGVAAPQGVMRLCLGPARLEIGGAQFPVQVRFGGPGCAKGAREPVVGFALI
ncbi:MAG: hypothetical protein ACFB2Z_06275 [Maricaulaceae bacterium]